MRKCANIWSYLRRPLLIYDFATAPVWFALYIWKISFSFLSVYIYKSWAQSVWKICSSWWLWYIQYFWLTQVQIFLKVVKLTLLFTSGCHSRLDGQHCPLVIKSYRFSRPQPGLFPARESLVSDRLGTEKTTFLQCNISQRFFQGQRNPLRT